jgi:sucrose phosphorylase
VLAAAAPHVRLITETNVPHRDNISYFGDGANEAHLVYNFALPPLTLHAFHTEDAAALTDWAAASLELPSRQTAFFNFLASHDGIGVTPALDLLGRAAVDEMAARVQALGGFVSYRHNPDGSQSPYELNVNFLDALGDPALAAESPAMQAKRFLAAEAIMLALRGLPGIYFHSLFGSHGWPEGVSETGRHRTINRQKLALTALEAELADPASLRRLVFDGHRRLLQARGRSPAFHPQGDQAILALDPAVFAVLRASAGGRHAVLCLHHVSRGRRTLDLDLRPLGLSAGRELIDLASGARFRAGEDRTLRLELGPYDVRWLAEARF